MAGDVRIDGRVAAKASDSVQAQDEISVAPRSRYVGRGGIKLEGAIAHFGINWGSQTMRLLAVYMGALGAQDVIPVK